MSNLLFFNHQTQFNQFIKDLNQTKDKASLMKEILVLIAEVPYDLDPTPTTEHQLKASELLDNFNYEKSSLLLEEIKKYL